MLLLMGVVVGLMVRMAGMMEMGMGVMMGVVVMLLTF